MAHKANILEDMSYSSCHRRQNVCVLRGEDSNNDRQMITCVPLGTQGCRWTSGSQKVGQSAHSRNANMIC